MSDKIKKIVKKTVLQIEPGAKVMLYGSRSRGEALEDSDWDFLILLNTEANFQKILTIRDALYEIELETGAVISSVIRSIENWNSPEYKVSPFYEHVMKECEVI